MQLIFKIKSNVLFPLLSRKTQHHINIFSIWTCQLVGCIPKPVYIVRMCFNTTHFCSHVALAHPPPKSLFIFIASVIKQYKIFLYLVLQVKHYFLIKLQAVYLNKAFEYSLSLKWIIFPIATLYMNKTENGRLVFWIHFLITQQNILYNPKYYMCPHASTHPHTYTFQFEQITLA